MVPYFDARMWTHGDVRQTKLDLCSMLRPSPYGDAVCVNAAIEINVLDYSIAVHSVNRL